MIRGAIENVTRNRIYGWIWSPDASTAGRTVLAFLDDTCIGSGRIEDFRQDLKDAGLGDGKAGFNFNLTYPNPTDAPRVIVKLEGSDAVLVQKRSKIMPPGAALTRTAAHNRGGPSPASLNWMRARGWISQSDYDYMRFFRQLGVYDRSLIIPPEQPGQAAAMHDATEMARHMLQLHRLEDVEVKRDLVVSPRDYRTLAEKQELALGPGAVLALWAKARGRVPLVEGSHTQEALVSPDADAAAAVDYAIGPDRLLMLDARTALGPGAAFPSGGAEVFYLAS